MGYRPPSQEQDCAFRLHLPLLLCLPSLGLVPWRPEQLCFLPKATKRLPGLCGSCLLLNSNTNWNHCPHLMGPGKRGFK